MLDAVATTLFVVALAVAILRYRLYDIDFVINRTLVYLLLSGCIVVAYVGVVAALGAIFQAKASVVISLIATGLVAAAFSPLRMRLQRSVDHLMYGERDQPYEVLARLGNRLAAATVAEEVLPSVAQTVAEAMRVPYVAVEMASEDGLSTIVAHGRPVDNALRLPLVHHGAQVGDLVVGPRGPNESFSAADRQLLDDLARQAAVAVHAVALTTDLRRSRERIVTAREEERRRLRRDLHDGLGPTLAAIAVRAEAAKRALQNDPDRAAEALSSIASDAQSAVIEVRRIVQDLRPPALDELGLVGAIRARADHFGEHLIIDVAAPDRLDDLPAAVESVAYRIVSEALTNVVRHSGASHAWVDIEERPQSVVIEVADDGLRRRGGRPGWRRPGVDARARGRARRDVQHRGAARGWHARARGPASASVRASVRAERGATSREHPSADRRRPSCVPKRPALPPQRARRHRGGRRGRERPPWCRARRLSSSPTSS